MSHVIRVGLLAVVCLAAAGGGYAVAQVVGGTDTVGTNVAPNNKMTCGTINCTGDVNGVITGTNPPQGCTCTLSGTGTVPACVYTASAADNCGYYTDDSSNCTGKVKGNPAINCEKSYPKCKNVSP